MNKRGWLLIVEAVMAVLIIFGFVFAAIAKQSQEAQALQEKPSLYNAANLLIQKAQENETIRGYILENDFTNASVSLNNEAKNMRLNLGIGVRICDTTESCSLLQPPKKEIYTGEAFITDGLGSKKIKVFVWQK